MTWPPVPPLTLIEGPPEAPGGRSLNGSHAVSAYQICERLGHLRYDQRLVSRVEKEFRLRGTLIHLGLAYYYADRLPQERRPQWYYEKDLITALEEVGAGLPDGIQRAREVVEAYKQRWPHNPWEAHAIEEQFFVRVGELDPAIHDEIREAEERYAVTFDAELRRRCEVALGLLRSLAAHDDVYVTCRPDLLATQKGSLGETELWEVDYKSKARPWTPWNSTQRGLERWKEDGEFALNWQVLMNLHILRHPSNSARMRGLWVKGFVIERVTRQPDKFGCYYGDRHPLIVPRRAYELTPRVIRVGVAKQMEVRQKVAAGIRPTPHFWSCNTPWGPCDFREVCMARSEEDAHDILARNFVVEE